MKCVVVIPCLNESATIKAVIDQIPKNMDGISSVEVVVIDDGSTDDSAAVAREAGAFVVSHGSNLGVGSAFRSGILEALKRGADVMVHIDGDGQFHPPDMASLVAPVVQKQADFVTASRFSDPSIIPEMPWIKKWGNHRMAQLVSALIGRRYYDVSCGFRAFSREALLHINLFGSFTYTQEVFLNLAFKSLRIKEMPTKVIGQRAHGKSRIASNLFRYAFQTSKIIFSAYRDYKPLRFFCFFSAMAFIMSFALGSFFLMHYVLTGFFSGHLWAGFSAGFLFALGLALAITGLIADMLGRIRRNQEEQLYYQKRHFYFNE